MGRPTIKEVHIILNLVATKAQSFRPDETELVVHDKCSIYNETNGTKCFSCSQSETEKEQMDVIRREPPARWLLAIPTYCYALSHQRKGK